MPGTDRNGSKTFTAVRSDVAQPSPERRVNAPTHARGYPKSGSRAKENAGSGADGEADRISAAPLAFFNIEGTQFEVVPSDVSLDGLEVLGSIAWGGRIYSIVSAEAAPPPNLIELLTKRELDIALLLYGGWHAKAIGRRLDISFHTVRVHTARIFAKLHMNNRSELVACVARQMWLGGTPKVNEEGRQSQIRWQSLNPSRPKEAD
jgi:DNA-binding CsgD family transcriptional regulator